MQPEYESDDYNDLPAAVPEAIVLTIPLRLAGSRIDAALAELVPDYSRSRLAQWIKDGKVTVDGAATTPKSKLWGGEKIQLLPEPDPETVSFQPEPVGLDIVYEDDAILVLNKPAGLVVHPAVGNWSGTLLNGLLYHLPQLSSVPRAGIVHRLDKDTSGLMVVAKTLSAQTHLVKQLQARTVKRHYLAVADGLLSGNDTVEAPIGRHPRERVKMAVVHGSGKPAITHWRSKERFRAHTLVECRLETGRTHQIRVHMAHIGHPLAADPVYGGRNRGINEDIRQALTEFNRQALHAAQLALVHPVSGKEMRWRAQPPLDFVTLLAVLRADIAPLDDDDWDDDEDDGDVEVIYVGE